ncbi:hypothetical protein ABT263_22610 [Kitasatospora sp. NPDC001603]
MHLTEAEFGPDGASCFTGAVMAAPDGLTGGFIDGEIGWTG